MKRNKIIISLVLLIQLNFSIAHAQVKEVAAIGFTVRDMDRSVVFYRDLLGFRVISDEEIMGTDYEQLQNVFGLHMRIVKMQLGDEIIELTDYLTSGGRSIPEDARSNDLFFQHVAIVVSDMDKAFQLLRKEKVSYVSSSPQTIPASNPAAAGIRAFYFQDPDSHNLELIYFPKGKGLEKWQRNNGRIFLGIDHTAIGVSNTDSSLRFYRDLLGLERKGDSWNNGPEQEHLNFVEGASLHITGLRATAGPGIEFLEYLKPGVGKPYPSDSRTDDIWHWQTLLLTDQIEKLFDEMKRSRYQLISRNLINLKTDAGGKLRAFIARDPDGHAMLLMEK